MISGRATTSESSAFASHARSAAGHFRDALDGISISSIGLGTYLGEENDAGFICKSPTRPPQD
jgi:hypothetical protein